MKFKFAIFFTTISFPSLPLSLVCYGLLRKGFTPGTMRVPLELEEPPMLKPSGPNPHLKEMTLNSLGSQIYLS